MLSKNYFFWTFLEVQLIRWDLRLLTRATANTWRSLYETRQLGWQRCWLGADAIAEKEIKAAIGEIEEAADKTGDESIDEQD